MASWERYFATCDAFIAPAMPMRAWRVDDGEWRVDAGGPADDSPRAQAFVALLLSQVSGCPMVVIPVGIDTNGVPFAIQVIGRRWHDEQLLAIAEAIAAVHRRIPTSPWSLKPPFHTANRRHSERLTTQTSGNARNTVLRGR
jgi:Asp-tRNA(Asn)/Glu-tRNA(Gln) amidotransferase A subunit family amidase